MTDNLSRREMLRRAAAVGAATAVPRYPLAQTSGAPAPVSPQNLTASEFELLEAIVGRLIPSDGNGPGALEAGAAQYIDRALTDALAASRTLYAAGLAALDAHARDSAGKAFVELDPNDQDTVLMDIEQNLVEGFSPDGSSFFNLVLSHTIQGTFCDPHYGGNQDFIGWEMIGYPGLRLAVTAQDQRMSTKPSATRISAYDLPMFESDPPEEGGS